MARVVEVDTEVCMCAQECVRIAPQAFIIDEEEMVARATPLAVELDQATLNEVVLSCPVEAISFRET